MYLICNTARCLKYTWPGLQSAVSAMDCCAIEEVLFPAKLNNFGKGTLAGRITGREEQCWRRGGPASEITCAATRGSWSSSNTGSR